MRLVDELHVMVGPAPSEPDFLKRSPLVPLVMATMASQALLVVLSPTIVAIGREFDASDGWVGQARSITAGVAITAAVAIARQMKRLGVVGLLRLGGGLAILGSGTVAASPTLPVFLAAHVLVGLAFACLLTAGFTGVAAFAPERRSWALGYVAGANALAWIIVNPLVGALTDSLSWRYAQGVPAVIALVTVAAAGAAAPVAAASSARGMSVVFATLSARRWVIAELIAYAAWAALLTFIGAFFVGRLGVSETAAGWLLASGAAAYFAASTHSGGLLAHTRRRHLVAASALALGALAAVQFATTSIAAATAIFCLAGLAAGIRTPASSGLGLEQLPDHPGAMMAARTATTQLGYFLGAAIGGVLITTVGYPALGVALAAGMAASAVLVFRVADDTSA